MPEVHQFVQSLVEHDAISTHARHLRRLLREMGIVSEIYAGEKRGGRKAARHFTDFRSTSPPEETWLLYHLSIGSAVADFLLTRTERRVVNYHNISPVESFAAWEPGVAVTLEAARRQLIQLAPVCEGAVGVSHYNEAELRLAGYTNTSVAPVLFDPADFERDPDRGTSATLQRAKAQGGADWLFVGRVSPHKAQHDLVKAFSVYRRVYDPNARLHIVGAMSSHHYWDVLNRYVDALGLRDAVNITGGVSNGALGAYYRHADVFVCLSEHEGFGVPLLEAMYNHVPVIAFDSAAVPETLSGAGLLLPDKSPSLVAAAVHKVIEDVDLARTLTIAGEHRLTDFGLTAGECRWREVIEKMVNA